jgi:hypothetical protein
MTAQRFVVGRNKGGQWCLMDYVACEILGTGKTFNHIKAHMRRCGIRRVVMAY